MENLEIIPTSKRASFGNSSNKDLEFENSIIKEKNILICDETKLEDEYSIIAKAPFKSIALSSRSLLEKDFKNKHDFEQILKQLEIISKGIGKKCKGHKQYLKKLTANLNYKEYFDNLNLEKNKYHEKFNNKRDSNMNIDFNKGNLRNFFIDFEMNVRKNNFEKSGLLLSKVFNHILLYNKNYNAKNKTIKRN